MAQNARTPSRRIPGMLSVQRFEHNLRRYCAELSGYQSDQLHCAGGLDCQCLGAASGLIRRTDEQRDYDRGSVDSTGLRTMSMLPLKYASSSITMPVVFMFPTSEPCFRIVIFCEASTSPWTWPMMTTSRAFTFESALPFGPMVRRPPFNSTDPWTSPSTNRSSSL